MKSISNSTCWQNHSILVIQRSIFTILILILCLSSHAFAQRAMRWGDTLGVEDEVSTIVESPEIQIISVIDSDTLSLVEFEASFRPDISKIDFLDIWRRANWPFYRISDMDTNSQRIKCNEIPYVSRTMNFIDDFTDTIWHACGSRGIGDPNVNYFYVSTVMDTFDFIIDDKASKWPSNCVAEFDQELKVSTAGNFNVISYPVDHGFTDAIDLIETIPTAYAFRKFNSHTQTWVNTLIKLRGNWEIFGDISVNIGDVYGISLDGSEPTVLFSTYSPGYIAKPGASSICFDRPNEWVGLAFNWMMAPMSYSYELKEAVAPMGDLYFRHLGEDIGEDVTTAIRVWVPSSQTAVNKAIYVLGPGWILNNPVLPGQPIAIMAKRRTSTLWPPTS